MSTVLIKSSECREQASKKTGTVYFFQHAAIELGANEFPKPFEILHDDPKKAYPPGRYRFTDDAIYVDRNGRLAVSARLVALPTSAKAAV